MNFAMRLSVFGLAVIGLAVLPSCAAVPDDLAGPSPTVEQIIAGFAHAENVGQITFKAVWRLDESGGVMDEPAGIRNGEVVMAVPPHGGHFVTEMGALNGSKMWWRKLASGEVEHEWSFDVTICSERSYPKIAAKDGKLMVAPYYGNKFIDRYYGKKLIPEIVRKLALFDMEKGVHLFDYETPESFIPQDLALSGDGRYLVAGYSVEESLVFDLDKPHPLLRLNGNDRGVVTAVGFSPDGKQVAIGWQAAIYVWDMATGKQAARFPFAKRPHYMAFPMRFGVLGERWVCIVRWASERPDRDMKETLECVELATGATLFALPSPHRGRFYPAFFLEDGKHLLCELSTEWGYGNGKDALCLFDAQGKLVSWGLLPPRTQPPSREGGYGNGGRLAITRDVILPRVANQPLRCWEVDYGLKQAASQPAH